MYKKNKLLRFSNTVDIIIINHFIDYYNYLWWSDTDLQSFKTSSYIEIKELINRHWEMSIRQAQKLLYQPGNIVYDENNFI
jgi:hypothetical protein